MRSTLAPRSRIWQWPEDVGSWVTMAGRSTPAKVFSRCRPSAMMAPVLPALTHACAWPCCTASRANHKELRRRARSTLDGRSPMPTTSGASTRRRRDCNSDGATVTAGRRTAVCPTNRTSSVGSRWSACSEAGTVTDTPWSPPMASTATTRVAVTGSNGDYSSSLSATTLRPR